jgi:hypothetical protein
MLRVADAVAVHVPFPETHIAIFGARPGSLPRGLPGNNAVSIRE